MNKANLLSPENPDLSVVIPCLDEEDTLATCLTKLRKIAEQEQFSIEVIVADNGSTDKSIAIVKEFNARVVQVSQKGYGAALMGGINKARAPYVLMADADDSYDFLDTPKFFEKINEDFDIVQGCRLPSGGGKIEVGAMPWSHRHIGNPLFTFLVRSWFGSPIHDVYCGMRVFKKSFYNSLKMRCIGMEFATEMIIKASNSHAKIAEVPITLHRDGRINHPPHLRTFRDGWKTLCFFLICAPSKLFLLPGIAMFISGLIGGCLAYFGTSIGTITLGAHSMLGSSLLIVGGFQSILVHLLCLDFSGKLGMEIKLNENSLHRLIKFHGFRISFFMLTIGIMLWAKVFFDWQNLGFGSLDYALTMKVVIPGATLISLALELFIFTLFRSWLKIEINH